MNPRLRKFLVALVVAVLTILLTQEEILELGIARRLELVSIDYRFKVRGPLPFRPESSHVVIVEINDESFHSLAERWPWPRSYYAHVIRNLKAAGARAVGLDIILNGPDARSPQHDADLRAAIRETGIVVLAGKLEVQHAGYMMTSASENFSNLFFAEDSALGLVNIRNDADGVYRRYSPFWEVTRAGGDTVRMPTFSFAILNKYEGLPPLATPTNEEEHFLFAGRTIPKFDPTSMLINFRGPSGTFRRIKFADVLDDESITTLEEAATGEAINTFSDPEFGYLHDGTFKDKIVIIGSTNPEDHDLFPVPIAQGSQHGDNLMYGVEIHANVIESILQSDFLRKQSQRSELLGILLASFLTFFVTSALRSGKSKRHFVFEFYTFLFVLVEIVAIAAAAVWAFNRYNLVLAVISPMTAVVGGYIASTAYHFVTERKQRILIKSMFSTYVNPAVVEELIANPDKLKLGGERKELTVLFSDIEGFTTISERMQSEELVALLNEYFSEMSRVILRNNGTVDKFFGDAIVAFWGAPLPQDDHALRACTAAMEMQNALADLRRRWQSEGKPLLRARIGINTGEMVVGNMGGVEKFDYTVIGDSVNIASRLEGANKVYRTSIMISETTYHAVKQHFLCRELDLISVKGRSEPLRTFEVLQKLDGPLDASLHEFLARYAEGLRSYRSQQWDAAETKFRQALALRSNDHPSAIHLERTLHFKLNPPPDDWNGVFELTTK